MTAGVSGSLPGIGGFGMQLGGTVYFNGDYRLGGATRVHVGTIDGTLLLSLARVNGRPSIHWRVVR